MEGIKSTFAKCKEQKRAALVAYITAGYPTVEETVDILLGLENGGAGMDDFYPADNPHIRLPTMKTQC
jgi:tryptophan synthase